MKRFVLNAALYYCRELHEGQLGPWREVLDASGLRWLDMGYTADAIGPAMEPLRTWDPERTTKKEVGEEDLPFVVVNYLDVGPEGAGGGSCRLYETPEELASDPDFKANET